MNTMDHNLLHHPIKFSIKTNDLQKLKKKPDKLFFKTELAETDIITMTVKEDLTKANNSNESNHVSDDILKGRPLICDNVTNDKIKKPPKRTHQSELEQETIKHRKIEEKDQVIIEPETSSALVIRGLPNTVAPLTVTKEQTILQIFSKCKDVMANKLEEKMDLIDRICKNSSVIQNSVEDGKAKTELNLLSEHKSVTKIKHISKPDNSPKKKLDSKIDYKRNKNKEEKVDLKDERIKKEMHNDKCNKGVEKLDLKIDNKKTKEIISKSKTVREQSNVEGKLKKIDKVECDNRVVKDNILDSNRSESRRSSHRKFSPDRSNRSSKQFSPSKSNRHRDGNRHKSRSNSKERRRHSKSPRKSRRNAIDEEESKCRKNVKSLQMGPLSLRDEFLLETDRSVVNPEDQLEESFNCKTTKVPIKDKRNIAERLQRLFNKTKILEELEGKRYLSETKEDEIQNPQATFSTFQPEDLLVQQTEAESSLILGEKVLFSLPSCIKAHKTPSVFTEFTTILPNDILVNQSSNEDSTQKSREKVSFLIPLTKGKKIKPVASENSIWFPSKLGSKPLPEVKDGLTSSLNNQPMKSISCITSKTIEVISECNETNNKDLKSEQGEFPRCLSLDLLTNDKSDQVNTISKDQSFDSVYNEMLLLNETENKLKSPQNCQLSNPTMHTNEILQNFALSHISHKASSKMDSQLFEKTQPYLKESHQLEKIVQCKSSHESLSIENPVLADIHNHIPFTDVTLKQSDDKQNIWAQESGSRVLEKNNSTIESRDNADQQLAREKVSFIISPRKVLTTESIITKIQKSMSTKVNSVSSNQCEIAEGLNSGISSSESVKELPINNTKDSAAAVEPNPNTTPTMNCKQFTGPEDLLEVSQSLSCNDINLNNDLNNFSVNQVNADKTGVGKSDKMHIEKIIIMEPQRKTCNISFRFTNIVKQKCNLTEIVNKLQHNSIEVECPEKYLIPENSFIKKSESSMKLPFILDNFLTLSEMKKEHVNIKELKSPQVSDFVINNEETELVSTKNSQNLPDKTIIINESLELSKDEDKFQYKSEYLTKPLIDTNDKSKSKVELMVTKQNYISDKLKGAPAIENLSKTPNVSIGHEIPPDVSQFIRKDLPINENEMTAINSSNQNRLKDNVKSEFGSKTLIHESRHRSKNSIKNDPPFISELKDTKNDNVTSKYPNDQMKSNRIYRHLNYRNKLRKDSKSNSRDRNKSNSPKDIRKTPMRYKRDGVHNSPSRQYSNNSGNISRERKRSFRSRSRYSMKRKSTDKTNRRRRSSSSHGYRTSSSIQSFKSRDRNRHSREDSFTKMKNNRFISHTRSSTSRKKYPDRRKDSRSQSKSRKTASHSKSKKHRERKDGVKTNIVDKIRKDSHRDEISKERKSRKSKEKSQDRHQRSKSTEKIKVKDRSKSLDKSILINILKDDNSESHCGDKSLCSLSEQSDSNVADKVKSFEVKTEPNQTNIKLVDNKPSEITDSASLKGKTSTTSETVERENDVKIVIKEKSCAEKCVLNLFNRHMPKTPDLKIIASEKPRTYMPDVVPGQMGNHNYYLQPQPNNIPTNNDYYINSQNFHQNQNQMYQSTCDPNYVHNSYPSHAVYQPTTYSNFYSSQPPTYHYESQTYSNYTENYSNNSITSTSYFPSISNTNEASVSWNTQQWNTLDCIDPEYNESTYDTPPPPAVTSSQFNQLNQSELSNVNVENCSRTRNSSTSSLSNSLIDMEIASASHKSMDSNVGLKLDDDVSNNDDLSSCGEFEYEDIEPQDPFQKYTDAPKPKYEHIIKTEVHVSAVGLRFEYAYLKSTSCNCVPPNPDEIRLGKSACDENCFNRKIKVECNRHCPVYELCTNRRFQEQIYAPIEPFYSGPDKGWGIRSMGNIPSGTFVIEYVGELIDASEFFKRVNETVTYNHHFLMVIQKDMYLDAGNKGNWARFVNHSCDPNTIIERWVVNGKTRIGLFSKKPISKDEEITIDYQFQQYGSVEQKCYCSSANCTGIMGKVNEKLQEQIKMSAIRQRTELIQRIISRKSLKEISHVSEMITVIKEHTLDRDTFVNFLDVLLCTSSHLCIRTFIECGGLNILTIYLDTVAWDDWPLKLLYLQCLDHFKLRKRTLINSGFTSATVVDYWSEHPRYETKHIADDSLNIDSFNDDTESVSDSLEPIPISNECPIQFSLPSSDEAISDIEKQVQSLAQKVKEYFNKEKEKFFIPKIKSNEIEFTNEFGANDSESKSISIASSVQGDFVQLKTRKLRNKCSEVIQKLSKDEFRRLFSERYNKSIEEKNQSLACVETNENDKNEEIFERIKQLLSNVITDEINNLKQSEQFSSMPLEFQNSDIDEILSSLNIVDKESLLPLFNLHQEDKSGSLSNYSKSSDETLLSSTDQLPPNWRFCRCDSGRIYFYHTISKKTQWETPVYPWDAGEDDPSSYDFGDAHKYLVTVDDCKDMLQRIKIKYREERLLERQRRRVERTLMRKLNLSEGERNKIKFSREVFKAVKVVMKPYFSSSCKVGRVKSRPDLKFLCEKFATTIIDKEVKLVANLEDLELNSDVSSKINSYIGKYMSNQGQYYKRSKKLKPKTDVQADSRTDSVGSFSTPNF